MVASILAGGLVFIGFAIWSVGINIQKALTNIECELMFLRDEIKRTKK